MRFIKIISNISTDKWLMKCHAVAQAHLGFILLIKTSLTPTKYEESVTHESIHIAQSRELLVIFWYLLYGGHFLINYIPNIFKVIFSKEMSLKIDGSKVFWDAYRNIIFEKEAYLYEKDADYINRRKIFACFRS